VKKLFPSHPRSLLASALFSLTLLASHPAQALVSSLGSDSVFTGIYINQAIGADAFYEKGFFGQNAIVANIEAGLVWNGHEAFQGRVSQQIFDPSITGQVDWHATMVAHAIAGNGQFTYQDGIAPLAQLWSGAIATNWVSEGGTYSNSFSISTESFLHPYATAMLTGINGSRADVINSSWGFSDPSGSDPLTIALDAMMRSSGTIGVFSAGNSGPGTNTVGGPSSGYNGITVGALTNSPTQLAYDQVASFSSRGASDAFNPQTNQTIPGIRATVDILAPGDHLTLAFYGGVTGGHLSGTDPTAGRGDFYIGDMGGTSFAAPIVAGAAALMVDAGKLYGTHEMTHALVIKATMMAAATPTQGWDNGQYVDGNQVIRTSQALDLAAGAGALNLENARNIYLGNSQLLAPSIYVASDSSTMGIDGVTGGSDLAASGWDYGQIQGGANLYTLAGTIQAGAQFSAVLTWYAARGFDVALGTLTDDSLSNLSLELWLLDQSSGDRMVGRSEAPWSTSEMLRFTIAETGAYQMRVVWDGLTYQTNPSAPTLTEYALAWSFDNSSLLGAVPETSSATMTLWVALFALRRRRPRRCA
jgi:hypothetical protein